MTGFFALLIRRAKANNGLTANQCWLVTVCFSLLNSSTDRFWIMTINTGNNFPAIGFETLGCVVCEPAFNFTIYRDAVVIIESYQLAKTQGSGQRTDFVEMPSIMQPSPRKV